LIPSYVKINRSDNVCSNGLAKFHYQNLNMNEQTIFLAALDIEDADLRSAYLDDVCADQPELRHQVDALLAEQAKSPGFMEVPVLEQIRLEVPHPADKENTWSDPLPSEYAIDLSFLEASTKAGCLGRLAHYEIREVIGHGGCGVVFRAFDEKLHRIVAVKTMLPTIAAMSPARKRFLREARATAAVQNQHVVNIHAVEESPLPYLVMEIIDGETLQQKLKNTGPLDVVSILRIGGEIAQGLAAAHQQGLVHRDIKPANILLHNGSGQVKITDFGLARAADDASLTQSGFIAGTPLYMSPEQARGDSVDLRTDLFSLGSVLYEMCSGRPPFRSRKIITVLERVKKEQPRDLKEIIPETPCWLIEIIRVLHAKDRDLRFDSAKQVSDVLQDCLLQYQTRGQVELSADVLNRLQRVNNEYAKDSLPVRSAATGLSFYHRARNSAWFVASLAGALLMFVLILLALVNRQNQVATLSDHSPDIVDGAPRPKSSSEHISEEPDLVSARSQQKDLLLTQRDPVHMAGGDWRGEYRTVGDQFMQVKIGNSSLVFGDSNWSDFDLSMETMTLNGIESGHLIFRSSQNGHDMYLFYFIIAEKRAFLIRQLDNTKMFLADPVYFEFKPHQWYQFRIKARGDRITAFVNDMQLFDVTDDVLKRGYIGLNTFASSVQWRNLQIKNPDGELIWEGFPNMNDGLTVSDDRHLAAYAIEHGGKVGLNSQPQILTKLAELPNGPFLLTDIKFESLSNLSSVSLEPFRKSRNLKNLGLDFSPHIDDVALRLFQENKGLESIGLSGTKITGAGLSSLADCRQLRLFWLTGTNLVDDEIATLKLFPQTLSVGLADTQVGDQGLVHVASLAKLKSLSLGRTKVTDDGLNHLSKLSNLTFIDLDGTSITDAGIATLAQFPVLNVVNLSDTPVTDNCIDDLIRIKSLRELTIQNSKITKAGSERINQERPGIRLTWSEKK
jgi:serine/threonine protein kinase